MAASGFVLVASPFTGPFAWARVAEVLRTRGERVAVLGVDEMIDGSRVLVGHSGAGARLPSIAGELGAVECAVYLDALLPHPGRSWAQTVPEVLVTKLESQAVGRRLPPWPQWWGEEGMRALIPDDALRAEFVAHCPAVPVETIHEVMPEVPEPPSVFVQLSAAYEHETIAARAKGWPTIVLDSRHLALLTDPEIIADVVARAATT